MLRIYGIEHRDTHCFDLMFFYLRRADADADVKDRNDKNVEVVPLEVKEIYEPVKK